MIAALGITNYSIREGTRVRNDHEKLQKFCNQIFSINICSTIVAYAVLFLLILFWPKLDGYTILLLIQSVTVVFTTIGTDWINSIYEDYEYITIRYIICQGVAVLLMFLLVKSKEDYLFYAFTSSFGTVLANIMNVGYIRKHYDLHPRFTIHMDVKRNLEPILLLFGSSIATTIYVNSDVTILGILKDENEVGLYSASSKFYSMVKQMLNASLTVAIPRISSERARYGIETVNSHLNHILSNLIIFSFPAAAGLFGISKELILLFCGAEFEPAYTSLEILSVSLIFATMGCFFVNVVMISFGMEKNVLLSTFSSAILNISLNFVLIPQWGQNAAALTTLMSEILVVVMGFLFTRHTVNIRIGKMFACALLEFIAVVIICRLIHMLGLGTLLTIILCVVLSLLACAAIIAVFDKEKIKEILKRKKS
jgi:O-antigen/teichoic acid export membrane protein